MTQTKGKPSRYAQLGEDGSRKVVPLQPAAETRARRHTAEFQVHRSAGRLVLQCGSTPVAVSRWLGWPEIADAFLFAIEKASVQSRQITVQNQARFADAGVFEYLHLTDPSQAVTLAGIDRRWVNGFVQWLDRKDDAGAPLWSVGTRQNFLGVLRTIFEALRGDAAWKQRISTGFSVPANPWPGAYRRKQPLQVLDVENLRALVIACREEVSSTMAACRNAWAYLDAHAEAFEDSSENMTDPHLWLRTYLHRHAALLPHYRWLDKNDKQLRRSMRNMDTSISALLLPICPDGRTALPFVLLLALYTAFNADTLRNLSLDDIDYYEGIAGTRIRFTPYKARAERDQVRSFATGSELGPDAIVEFVVQWTCWLRPRAPEHLAKRVFLLLSNERNPDGSPTCGGYDTKTGEKGGGRWNHALASFLQDHGLPPITLAQLRKVSLDLVHELTSGDLKAVQVAGGQQDPQVILDHYQSSAAQMRNEEALGLIMATRERWVATEGKTADPRKEPYSADKGCATPGWRCHDPFDSPAHGEASGRLCQALGQCPACPLAAIDSRDPYAVARAFQLRDHINLAQQYVAPDRWLAVYAPVAERLDTYWLPLMSDEGVLHQARQLTLAPLPPLD